MTKIEDCVVVVPVEFFHRYEQQVLDLVNKHAFELMDVVGYCLLASELIKLAREKLEPASIVGAIDVLPVARFIDYVNELGANENSPADSVFFHAKYKNI